MAPVREGSLAVVAWVLGVLAGGLVGCGDALVDERYQGTPRFSLEGQVVGSSERVNLEHPEVQVALFWISRASREGEMLIEQAGTARSAEDYRAFTLKLFDEPREEDLLVRRPGARLGVARVGAYLDENRNGRRDEVEPLLGASFSRILLRAPQDLPARDSLTGAPLAEGWHVVSAPLDCPPPPDGPPALPGPAPVPEDDCGVPLGEPCKGDADCGGGTCLFEAEGPWPSGACVIPEPPPSGCRQRGSVLMRGHDDGQPAYWIKACASSAECGRPAPYQCDQQLRGCRPSAEIVVEVSDREPPPGFCRAAPPGP